MIGLATSTWYYRQHPRARVAHPIPQSQREYSTAIGQQDRAWIEARIQEAWEANHSVLQAYADTWDEGEYRASERTWWRIAGQMENQEARPTQPTKKDNRKPREAPRVEATKPAEVWSWDITDLLTPFRGTKYKAYVIIDIFSRFIVGYRVEHRESDTLAVELFDAAIDTWGAPRVVHADSGPAMRSNALQYFLIDTHNVEMTHNRPYVSNDNPFSESEFHTMKYRPGYPVIFETIEEAREYLETYTSWYNQSHCHSALALFRPIQVHNGTWEEAWEKREATLTAYWEKHPQRYRDKPTTPKPPGKVGINTKKTPKQQAPKKETISR